MRHKKCKSGRASKPRGLGRLLMMLPFAGTLLYPVYLANQLDVCRETFVSDQLPAAFDGLTVAFAADIHYGQFFSEERVRALAEKLNGLKPDVLVLGGDYGEDSDGALAFWKLRPGFAAGRLMAGVLGNHDRTLPESNKEKIMDAMRENGVMPLCNDAVLLRKDGHTLALAGIDDYYNGAPDAEKTAALCRDAEFTLFLSHTPDALPDIKRPFYQLALCGHTHGGQVAVLGHALHSSSDYGSKYLSGWYRIGGARVFVTNGVGTSALPVRLGARPQIHLITLKRP